MNKIKLSIIVTLFCHERYLEQALDSILMQHTDFEYEVLIGEDCSPDRTAAVLRVLEPKLPANFHIFYREKNLGERENNRDLQSRSRGQYIIFLEGDDYWTDSYKLQKQVDFLDANPEYIAIAHGVEVVNAEGKKRDDFVYPQCPYEEYTVADFCAGYLSGQTASMMMRNIFRDKMFPLLELNSYYPGDQQKNFMLAGHGRVLSAREVMSAYRYAPEGGTSYSAMPVTQNELRLRQIRAYEGMYQYALHEFKRTEDVWQMELAYMKALAAVVRDHLDEKYTIGCFFSEFSKCRWKGRIMVSLCVKLIGFICKKVRKG